MATRAIGGSGSKGKAINIGGPYGKALSHKAQDSKTHRAGKGKKGKKK